VTGPGHYDPEKVKNLEHVRHYNFGNRKPLHEPTYNPGKGNN